MILNEVFVNFLKSLNEYLLIMGIPGLLAISFLDSAAVPLAGGPDAVILLLAWRRPAAAVLIVLAATFGSTLGCLVLYGIGRKGGDKALSRFSLERTARIKHRMQENASWAIFAAVIAPPPLPTKLVILAAGVLQTGKIRFTLGVFAGRLVRYSLIAYLAARFGDHAAQVLKSHYPAFSLLLIGFVLLIFLIRKMRNRNRHAGKTE
jgi:membrane protein YqaA with SNARE-associated domain